MNVASNGSSSFSGLIQPEIDFKKAPTPIPTDRMIRPVQQATALKPTPMPTSLYPADGIDSSDQFNIPTKEECTEISAAGNYSEAEKCYQQAIDGYNGRGLTSLGVGMGALAGALIGTALVVTAPISLLVIGGGLMGGFVINLLANAHQ